MRFCLLVVAKAPVAGLAKTRLMPEATPREAAAIASAALLDTLSVVRRTPDAVPLIALTGDVAAAHDPAGLRAALGDVSVFAQRGRGLAERLGNAHADAAARHPGLPVVQIGMDTPQVTPRLLGAVAAGLVTHPATLGVADDGGWWALGLRDPAHAAVLRDVPMSRADTAARTRDALAGLGLRVGAGPRLTDVDTMADAFVVAREIPGSRFAAAVVGAGAVR
ncbi:MAG TPA: DUF2064 domain-containing protein [Pseudonocardiaceae bacterium]|jgi:hypothetical protein|nr:DUF2064 domain-containing protein [Pseudonocardiaceae bacterium]